MAWLTGWTYRRKLTIDQLKVDADLTDFPILVKLTSARLNFSKARSDGFDIRFTSSDGITLLKYERERHDSANSLAEYWIKIPVVSGTVDTDIYIYYGKADATDGADPTAVWDTNFKTVYHLKDITTSTINDSTVNALHGTKKAANEPLEIDGKVAKAQDFDGTDDYISLPDSALLRPTVFTISFWGKDATATDYDDSGTFQNLVKPAVSDYRGWFIRFSRLTTGFLRIGITICNVSVFEWAMTSTVSDTLWHYYTLTYDGTTRKAYMDGELLGSTTEGSLTYATTHYPAIGARRDEGTPIHYFRGEMDELRLSNIVRSTAWIKASYNSGHDSLLTYGAEEQVKLISITEQNIVSFLRGISRTFSIIEQNIVLFSKGFFRTFSIIEQNIVSFISARIFFKIFIIIEQNIVSFFKDILKFFSIIEVNIISFLKGIFKVFLITEQNIVLFLKGVSKVFSITEQNIVSLIRLLNLSKYFLIIEKNIVKFRRKFWIFLTKKITNWTSLSKHITDWKYLKKE